MGRGRALDVQIGISYSTVFGHAGARRVFVDMNATIQKNISARLLPVFLSAYALAGQV